MAVTKSSPSSLEQYGVGVGWGRKVRIAGVGESLSCGPITERTPSRGRPKELIRRTGALGKATISSGKARKRVPGGSSSTKGHPDLETWRGGRGGRRGGGSRAFRGIYICTFRDRRSGSATKNDV